MKTRAQELIDKYELKPHPEGGYYREVFRSVQSVKPAGRRTARSALTAIYFLLSRGQYSRWHCVLSDEIWYHLEGEPLVLYGFEVQGARLSSVTLGGSATIGTVPMHGVPAGVWQAAEPRGEYALLGCCVGPGFDFRDFRLATDDPRIASIIQKQGVEFERLL